MARGQQQRPLPVAGVSPQQARLSPQKNMDLKRAMREDESPRKAPVPASIGAKIKTHVPEREKRRALEAREINKCSEKAHDSAAAESPRNVSEMDARLLSAKQRAAADAKKLAAQKAEEKRRAHADKEAQDKSEAQAKHGPDHGGYNEEDIKAALDHHNELRARHGAPPLKWKESLAQDAQKAANQCVEKGTLHHSNHAGAGQNGAMGYGSFQGAIDGWYSEISDYDFEHGGFTMGTGHFTQVVWKSTTHVGMARDTSGNGRFIFANYFPPGNFMGRFDAEVQKTK